LVWASIFNLTKKRKNFLDPRMAVGFSDEQKQNFPEREYDSNSMFFWAKGKSLMKKGTFLIPAQLVFWTYNREHFQNTEPLLREINTNGAGGHFTHEQALLSGLYETIQRDAFFIYWWNCKAPPVIDNSTIDSEKVQKLIAKAERYGYEVTFLDITSDIEVPSCVCVLVDKYNHYPKMTIGAGTGMSAEDVLVRSFEEAHSIITWLCRHTEEEKEIPYFNEKYPPFKDSKINQKIRLQWWGRPDSFTKFKFFLEGKKESFNDFSKKEKHFSSHKEELRWVTECFKKKGEGYEIYYYDAKHQVLKDLGYFSVKVIIPNLIPLYLREDRAPLQSNRRISAPKEIGFEPLDKCNPLPHMFP